MTQRRLLYFDGSHLAATLWRGGRLVHEDVFSGEEADLSAFHDYLAAHAGSNFYLLADMPDEGFQAEGLPYTQGADRKALLARKLGQYFYGSPFATAVSLGREKSGRRDERILFAALTRPQPLERWLQALRAACAPLAGIYTPALLSAPLLRQAAPGLTRCVLVTVSHTGIRQTFFDGGQLRFSRLTPLTDLSLPHVAQTCAAESEKIYQYLSAQRLVPRGPLPTLLMVHRAHAAAFSQACRSSDELQYQILDIASAGHGAGMKDEPADSFAEPLFLHLLGSRRPQEQFAPAAARYHYRLWQTRVALLGVAGAIFLGCALAAAKNAFDTWSLREKNAALAADAERDGQRYAAVLKGLPPLPTSADNLRALIDRYQLLEKRSPDPLAMYVAVSRAMNDYPRIELDKIEWSAGERYDDPAAGARQVAAARGADAGGAATRETATLYGQLPIAMLSDQRGLLNTINGFASALRQQSKLDVAVSRMPFDIESGKTLKGGGEDQGRAEPPRFVLRAMRGAAQ